MKLPKTSGELSFYASVRIGSPWPVGAEVNLIRFSSDGTELRVFADPTGRLCATSSQPEIGKRAFAFQRCRLLNEGWFSLHAILSKDNLVLGLDGFDLLPKSRNDADVPFYLASNNSNDPRGKIFPQLVSPSLGLNDPNALFIAKIVELDRLIAGGTWYDLISSTAILRLFLLDGFLDKVNQKFRHKIRFTVRASHLKPPIAPAVWFFNLDSSLYKSANIESISLDQFLAKPTIYIGTEVISVRDVVHTAANVMGGVHFGEPRTSSNQEVVRNFDELVKTGPHGTVIGALTGIGRVTLRAIAPLVASVSTLRSRLE